MINHTKIIAEAGVNHNGSIKTAKKMIDAAADAGADYVKFQTFKSEKLLTMNAKKAEYQKKLTEKNENQFEMLKKLELSKSAHKELMKHCDKKGITFLSTPFDNESIDLLRSLNIPYFKIPSGEITNFPYLQQIAKLGKPIILSTGMSTLKEVRQALDILIESGAKKKNVTILHCHTEYPTSMEDVNLNAMLTMRQKLNVNIGYSDHTLGIEISLAAVALGAKIIEKHFTLDRKMEGPDQAASLEPNELKSLVISIRNVEKALGDGLKKPTARELRNSKVVRKSIVAKKNIKKGDILSEDNLTVKRPADGLSPMKWKNVVGKIACKNFNIDDKIEI